MTKINTPISIFWFRRDLRIDDNNGLFKALKSGLPVLPIFIFDSEILSKLDDKADKRVDLIRQMLVNIQKELEVYESTLLVKYGHPFEVMRELFSEFDIKAVYTNRDYEPYAIKRDKEISAFLVSRNAELITFKDQVIFEWNEALKPDSTPYTVFTPYSRKWKQNLTEKDQLTYPTETLVGNFLKIPHQPIPDLQDIGFLPTGIVYSKPTIDEEIIKNYENTRNIPSLEGTTDLSVHLRFGTVSIRKLLKIGLLLNETWLNELIWREFFMSILVHFPYVENGAFKKKYNEITWRNNEKEFELWCEGKTGYPMVDAGMRQLNETGLMHNRVRMITASFLTKHLLIDWRWGEAYFAQKLLDYDLSANNGNWQWAAGCGCDAAPYFRIFNPTEQTKRYDPDLKYINKWVKEINSFEYPEPIVDHKMARERVLKAYKSAVSE
ncbi:MAG TPA: deoxyribodipyrimidine photo-lyase [Paludibacter sp.]|nr:deoxyribodipyrimidine photo-lyase [Paludibacter sp.]